MFFVVTDELGHVWAQVADIDLALAMAEFLFKSGHTPSIVRVERKT